MTRKHRVEKSERGRRRRGFSLVELLVAVAVMGVAISLFISLFRSSAEMAAASRNRSIATSLAEERLADLRLHADAYAWPPAEKLAGGEQAEVTPAKAEGAAATGFKAPSSKPVDAHAARIEQTTYDAFSWQAFVRLPDANAAYVEITVVVRWTEHKRQKLFALTSAMPRSQKGGAA